MRGPPYATVLPAGARVSRRPPRPGVPGTDARLRPRGPDDAIAPAISQGRELWRELSALPVGGANRSAALARRPLAAEAPTGSPLQRSRTGHSWHPQPGLPRGQLLQGKKNAIFRMGLGR